MAGGSGTRLYPLTKSVSKQLLPIYDKPMVYYPISVLMMADITEILLITTPNDMASFQNLLGDGSNIGLHFEYVIQPSPDGLAQAFILGKDFIAEDNVCFMLGDNILYGHNLQKILATAIHDIERNNIATIFGYRVFDPEHYGVAEFNAHGDVISIEEKPKRPKSNYAVTGLYFYPNDVVKKALLIKPSARGELEITTVNQLYLEEERLRIQLLGRGYTWLDAGTYENLLEASQFIETIEKRQGLKIACIEEIAFLKGYINKQELIALAKPLDKNQYGKYLMQIATE